MDDDVKAHLAVVFARHTDTWRLCAQCSEAFERDRQAVQLGLAGTYCPHNGVHQVWNATTIMTQLCASREQAERIDAVFLAARRGLDESPPEKTN